MSIETSVSRTVPGPGGGSQSSPFSLLIHRGASAGRVSRTIDDERPPRVARITGGSPPVEWALRAISTRVVSPSPAATGISTASPDGASLRSRSLDPYQPSLSRGSLASG